MSSAITLVGNQQVIALTTRLIIGIRLQGTIGFIDPRSPYSIKPRPYLAYFAETLRRLHCDVTLFVPTNEEHDRDMIDRFHQRDFPVPFHYIHDHSKFVGAGAGRGNRKHGIAPNNYTEYLRIKAHQANGTGQATDRILFIDSEANYRFTPVQTLILDSYAPLTPRQQRTLMKSQHSNPFGDVSSQQARRVAAAAARATGTTGRHRAMVHAQHMQDELNKIQSSTDLLRSEQERVPLVDLEDDFETLAARRGRPHIPPRSDGMPTTDKSGRDPRGRIAGADLKNSSSASTPAPDKGSAETGMSHALAINLEDYSLVALSEMIAEMAASDVSVSEYLKMEPLIEKVEIPFHGKANYLPPENCDHIDLLHWDEIKVMETKARDTGVPETVEETAEHKNFFQ